MTMWLWPLLRVKFPESWILPILLFCPATRISRDGPTGRVSHSPSPTDDFELANHSSKIRYFTRDAAAKDSRGTAAVVGSMTLHGPDVALVSGRDREEPEQYPSPRADGTRDSAEMRYTAPIVQTLVFQALQPIPWTVMTGPPVSSNPMAGFRSRRWVRFPLIPAIPYVARLSGWVCCFTH